jgi:hypothetical protein
LTSLTPREFRQAIEDALLELDQPGFAIVTTLVVDGYVSLALGHAGHHLWVPRQCRQTREAARAWLVERLRDGLPALCRAAGLGPPRTSRAPADTRGEG